MPRVTPTKTELVWPGKYDEDGALREPPRVRLPFQVIETINESRATRDARNGPEQNTLFTTYVGTQGETFDAGWKNKLIWGDNLLVMGSLLEHFSGKIDLIYIDPPFATGANFNFKTPIGNAGTEVEKQQSIIEEKAYRDTWGRGRESWFDMIYHRIKLMRQLLSETGTLYIHLDWYVGHHVRPVLDEIFGENCSLGEVIWAYGSPSGGRVSGSKLVKSHDLIYIYAKSYGQHKYKIAYLPYSEKYIKDWFKYVDDDGRRYQKRQRRNKETGEMYWEKQFLDESKGVPASTVWTDIQQAYADPRAYKIGTTSEITGYATQKPERLVERIISISSEPGDLVADFFCGSGTTLAVAEKLQRRWIGCDLGRWAIHVTRKRMLGITNCKPYELLNLGSYERQYWQGVMFGSDTPPTSLHQRAVYEYIAFILRLYGAHAVPGLLSLHGKKARAMIHVGAVDAPVTIRDIDSAINECIKIKQPELHVLGWEWEMGLNDLIREFSSRREIALRLFNIPREVMESTERVSSQIKFYELSYLDAKVVTHSHRRVQVRILGFVIPNPEDIPSSVRNQISQWSDYIDYWAIDWNFQNDTFMQGWVTYRTRKDRNLSLISDYHKYEASGSYRILVKVIDIFGNDTSQVLTVQVT